MMVLDASVVIALLKNHDPHRELAAAILKANRNEDLIIHPITLAECLVGPAKSNMISEASVDIEALGIETSANFESEPVKLATLRAQTGLKLPDCCVLLTATELNATLATFDSSLATAAKARGINTFDLTS